MKKETMKTIVITGSTRGIGFALASEFLKKGYQVVISDRTDASVESSVEKLAVEYSRNQIVGLTTLMAQHLRLMGWMDTMKSILNLTLVISFMYVPLIPLLWPPGMPFALWIILVPRKLKCEFTTLVKVVYVQVNFRCWCTATIFNHNKNIIFKWYLSDAVSFW